MTGRAALIKVCGEVKGVGFRRFVWRLAKQLGLKGYVENAPGKDCVRVYAEGDGERLEELVRRIDAAKKVYCIASVEVTEQAYTGRFSDFVIVKCLGEEEV
jgi:acylphosphatase